MQTLTTYEFLGAAGIFPSSTATYTLAQITAAVKAEWVRVYSQLLTDRLAHQG